MKKLKEFFRWMTGKGLDPVGQSEILKRDPTYREAAKPPEEQLQEERPLEPQPGCDCMWCMHLRREAKPHTGQPLSF